MTPDEHRADLATQHEDAAADRSRATMWDVVRFADGVEALGGAA